jgi:hypothetical protein
MDPRRKTGSIPAERREGGRVELRETSPRSPTPGLPGDARPKG